MKLPEYTSQVSPQVQIPTRGVDLPGAPPSGAPQLGAAMAGLGEAVGELGKTYAIIEAKKRAAESDIESANVLADIELQLETRREHWSRATTIPDAFRVNYNADAAGIASIAETAEISEEARQKVRVGLPMRIARATAAANRAYDDKVVDYVTAGSLKASQHSANLAVTAATPEEYQLYSTDAMRALEPTAFVKGETYLLAQQEATRKQIEVGRALELGTKNPYAVMGQLMAEAKNEQGETYHPFAPGLTMQDRMATYRSVHEMAMQADQYHRQIITEVAKDVSSTMIQDIAGGKYGTMEAIGQNAEKIRNDMRALWFKKTGSNAVDLSVVEHVESSINQQTSRTERASDRDSLGAANKYAADMVTATSAERLQILAASDRDPSLNSAGHKIVADRWNILETQSDSKLRLAREEQESKKNATKIELRKLALLDMETWMPDPRQPGLHLFAAAIHAAKSQVGLAIEQAIAEDRNPIEQVRNMRPATFLQIYGSAQQAIINIEQPLSSYRSPRGDYASIDKANIPEQEKRRLRQLVIDRYTLKQWLNTNTPEVPKKK